jgi:hypothetical protein
VTTECTNAELDPQLHGQMTRLIYSDLRGACDLGLASKEVIGAEQKPRNLVCALIATVQLTSDRALTRPAYRMFCDAAALGAAALLARRGSGGGSSLGASALRLSCMVHWVEKIAEGGDELPRRTIT